MKVDKAILSEIILEEIDALIEAGELDEGWWDKLRARTAGAGETIKGVGSGLRAKVGGAVAGIDPGQTTHGKKAARAKGMAKFKKLNVILQTKREELHALHTEFRTDLEALGLAGPDIANPSGVMRQLNVIFDSANESLESMQKKLDQAIALGAAQSPPDPEKAAAQEITPPMEPARAGAGF